MAVTSVLERDAEREALAAGLAALARGEGSVVLIEGPAGIGKTALLGELRGEARAAGVRVLSAVASELDRDFAFGLVQQLLGPELATASADRRAALLDGAAALAAPVVAPGAGESPAGDVSHGVLHGLYWLVANLAEEAPVALLVDDLHWADRPSLRALEFLARRLDGLPLLVVGTLRPGEPGSDVALLDALAAGTFARTVRPGPLSPAAAERVLAGLLGGELDPAFAAAAHELSAGNPLLVRELARAAVDSGLHGRADEAGALPRLTAQGVAPTVMRRLRALGDAAVAAARAVAIVGPRAQVADVAAVAGLDEPDVEAALDALVVAGVLEAGERRFSHPLVGAAVEADTAPALRARMHAAAADRLALRGARPAEIALHLLATEPAGEPAVVEHLRAAATAARAEGAVDAAVRHLRRALDEPPAPDVRPAVLLELGEAEVLAGVPDGWDHLEEVAAAAEGDQRARARIAQASTLVGGLSSSDAVPLLEEARAALSDPDLGEVVDRLLIQAVTFDLRQRDRWETMVAPERLAGAPPTLLVNRAYLEALTARPGPGMAALRELSATGELFRRTGGGMTFAFALVAPIWVEEAELGRTVIDEGEAGARQSGHHIDALVLSVCGSLWHQHFGSLAVAEEQARRSVELALEAGYTFVPSEIGQAVDVLLERDDVAGAQAMADLLGDLDEIEHYLVAGRVHAAVGRLRHHQHRDGEAIRRLREAVRIDDAWGFRAPLHSQAHLSLARLLRDPDEALSLVTPMTAVAREAGLPGSLGVCLRAEAALRSGDEAIELLREAEASLAASALGLEHAWVLHDLGARLRRAGARTDAREQLRRALDLAERLGALRLARLAREELLAAGGRPQRTALSGAAALTPSEQRVAELAARGLSNREIAETLWVTRKTVEVHLGNAYRKLDIRGRTALADALAA